MKYLTHFCVLVIVIVLSLTSCNKSESVLIDNESVLNNNDCENVLYFEDVLEVTSELKKISSMNLDELLKWQELKSFSSIGVKSDLLYSKVDPDSFKSLKEIENFVNSNLDLLILEKDDNNEFVVEGILPRTSLRYLANMDYIFAVGSVYHKVFDCGVVESEDYKLLQEINFEDALQLGLSVIHFDNHSDNYTEKSIVDECGYDKNFEATDGRNRIKLYLCTYAYYGYPYSSNVQVPQVYFSIKPYRRTIAWFNVSRVVKCNINFAIKYLDQNSNLIIEYGSHINTVGTETSNYYHYFDGTPRPEGYDLGISFKSYNCEASIPTVTVNAICN